MEDHLGALSRVRFVLCRPRNPMNIGAAARALQCAGIHRWTLVDPQTRDFDTARVVAVHAGQLLAQVSIVPTLREALEGCALSIGTTTRERAERALLPPREAAERATRAAGEIAFVFGDERSGLTADEVEACDLLSTIPSAPEQPSWNLAQAIAIYAHELRAAALSGLEPGRASREPADAGALAAVDRALKAALRDREGARRRLFRTLERAQLSGREAALWTAILTRLRRS